MLVRVVMRVPLMSVRPREETHTFKYMALTSFVYRVVAQAAATPMVWDWVRRMVAAVAVAKDTTT